MTASSAYTCISCHAVFSSSDAQREHYRSEWHRCNLRRKVDDVPPLTEAVFLQRILDESYSGRLDGEKGVVKKKKRWECDACKRTFSSEKALANHHSTKHSSPLDTAKLDNGGSSHDRELGKGDCFLCLKQEKSFETLVVHLTTGHHLYLPDLAHIVNLSGLVEYLQAKVGIMYACLYCHDDERFTGLEDERQAAETLFRSAEAVKRHMQDKGHAKIRFDDIGQVELARFYDYGGVLMESDEYETVERFSQAEDDDAFVDISSNADEQAIPLDRQQATAWIAPDETEMLLPSGARIGNRAYRRYYRQNLVPYNNGDDAGNSVLQRRSSLLTALMLRYKEAGQPVHGFRTPRSQQVVSSYSFNEPDSHQQQRIKRDQQVENNSRKQQELGVGIRTNRLQKHFREQIL